MNLELISTCGEGEDKSLECQNSVWTKDASGVENEVVNLYPEVTFQGMEGFGGAITDSAAYVYSLMSEEQKRECMEIYFSPEKMKYNRVRIHMDSCDFSTEMYEAMSDPSDTELKSFNFERTEKYIIPMLEDAQKMAGKPLMIMLSPWSPPSFMKTNGKRIHGGSLKTEYQDMWAEYICRYIEAFKEKGFVVERISLQNEAKAVQTWDSCVYTAAQEKEFLQYHMIPALKAHGLSDIGVYIWDHNKERVFERACEIIDDETKDMVEGIAFHWYSGDHFEALDLVRRKFPDLKMIISESCIEYTKFGANEHWPNAARLSHEMIGDLNNGMCGFYDWNLILDEKGGPNHVGNFCHAAILYDRKNKKVMPQLILKHFYHFSHYIVPGAVRIGYSKYTDKLDVTAFKNPDGTIAAVFLNRSKESIPVHLRMHGKTAAFTVMPESIMTAVTKVE